MSSIHNKFISDVETIPVGSSKIFNESPHSTFATVSFGTGLYPPEIEEELFNLYLKLRANVYITQTGMIDDSHMRLGGIEIDGDDERSYHIGVVKNLGAGAIAMVGCMRSIEKRDSMEKLPIEHFFPEVFNVGPAPVNAAEASRLIARCDSKKDQMLTVSELFSLIVAHFYKEGLDPVYGVVEESFERTLKFLGAPPTRIAEPKTVEEYNDENLGVLIDIPQMIENIGERISTLDTSPGGVNYWGDTTKRMKRVKKTT